jgi:hypothetical protein
MRSILAGFAAFTPLLMAAQSGGGTVSGELKKWHRVTVTFDGPSTSESAATNPFRDYRLDVTFTRGARSVVVPGYYAADGNAAESGATAGSRWRVHFCPDEEGSWTYTASFRTGTDAAVGTGGTAAAFHGATGSFSVGPTDKTGRDHRAQGRLRYVGKHHLQFAQTGRYFLKGGADSPENLLAFADFDGTPAKHSYAPHAGDWTAGDPTWRSGKGKNLVGALNYLASEGMNSVYFLTMNVGGDGKDVWPWTGDAERYRFDCSKLDQWEIVFSHMDRLGLMLHVVTQETENDQLLDGGSLGFQRKLYYRELAARFSHHLAVVWNVGEENTNTDAQRKAFADHLRALDPYDNPVVVHTYPGQYDAVYDPLLGYASYEGPSLQMGDRNAVHAETAKWVRDSAAAGRRWFVSLDEIGPANDGVLPDANDPAHDSVRKQALWGNLMGGGAGCEWYFGYAYAHSDLTCEDWRSRNAMWDQTRWALEFFQQHLPFADMVPSDGLASTGWCLAKAGETYAVYLPNGSSPSLDLPPGTYGVRWYNPRAGGPLQDGSLTSVSGGGSVSLGSPPADAGKDWAVRVTLTSGGGGGSGGGTAQEVSSLTLIDADTDQPVAGFDAMESGAVLNLGLLPTRNLNVRANTTPSVVGSVRFEFDGDANYHVESAAPYALAGDSSGNFNAWTPALGAHTLVAVPYTSSGASGTAGTPKVVAFTVVDDGTTPNDPGGGAGGGGGGGGAGSAAGSGGGGSDGGGCGATGAEALLLLLLLAFRRARRGLAPFLGILLVAGAAQAQTFQESGGIVVMEVESAPLAGSWVKETSIAGSTGSGYYRWNGADQFGSPGQGVLSYAINVANPGEYNLRIRNHHNHPDSTLENDCFTRMDGGSWIKTYSSTANQWTWHTRHEEGGTHSDPKYTLSAGVHTFQISGRSRNFRIDRIHLYLGNVAGPLDETRPESLTTTGGGTTTPPPPTTPPPTSPPAPTGPGSARENDNGDTGCFGSVAAAGRPGGALLWILLATVLPLLRRRR